MSQVNLSVWMLSIEIYISLPMSDECPHLVNDLACVYGIVYVGYAIISRGGTIRSNAIGFRGQLSLKEAFPWSFRQHAFAFSRGN